MPKLYAGGRGVSLVAVAQAVTKLVPVIVPLIVPKVPEMTKTFQVISGDIAPNSYKGFGVNPCRYRLVENGGFRTMKPVRKSPAIRTRNHKVKYRNVDDPLCRRSPPTKGRAARRDMSGCALHFLAEQPREASKKRASTELRHRIRQPFTGPALKNTSGVTTPSRLNTMPSFITNWTSRRASMSSSGLPGTAIMSAAMPGLIGPRWS